jgi:ATP-dependent Clp protease ATP-binding subunit ClpA
MSAVKELPRWMRELQRYLPIKTQFYIYGNIYDQILYPLKQDNQWIYLSIRDFFYRFFLEQGYKVIGFYDIVDGMEFKNKEMQNLYREIIKGKEIQPKERQSSPEQEATQKRQEKVSIDDGLDNIRKAVANRSLPTVFVIDYSSRLATTPNPLYGDEKIHFLKILKCAQDAAVVTIGDQTFNNLSVLLCDKLNDIPPWLYLNNPLTKPLQIDKPDEGERRKFIEFALNKDDFLKFHDSSNLTEEEKKKIIDNFVAFTDGLGNYELQSLTVLSEREQISIRDDKNKSSGIKNIVERYKFGIRESAWDKVNPEKLKNAESELRKRVKGQEQALQSVLDIIKRSKMGLSGVQHSSKSSKPRGILFFAGPTGVGKTEMAKALAELLFGDEKACIRFDMSEYSLEHADQKLLGAPPGYVGYEEGGQLTNKIKEHPFSVLLFDEIEKAHPSILDKFLQILEDGRMTDGKGETVYFSESIIIFTSNKGVYTEEQIIDNGILKKNKKTNIYPTAWCCDKCSHDEWIDVSGRKPDMCGNCNSANLKMIETPYYILKKRIETAIRDYFNLELGRPELLNRFGDNFVVFDYIRPPIIHEIIDKIINNIIKEVADKHKIKITFSDEVISWLFEKAKKNIEHGGRGIGNLIEGAVVNPLARKLFDENLTYGGSIIIEGIETVSKESVEFYSLKTRRI